MRLPACVLFLLRGLCSVSVSPGAAQSRRPGPAQKSPVPAAARSAALIEPTIPETTIRVDVNLVSFPATVTDHYRRYVGSLRRQDFTLLEAGVPQKIAVFHNEIVPVSVGVVIDTSGSMADKIQEAADALTHFVNTIQPEDDVFLIRFARTGRSSAAPPTGCARGAPRGSMTRWPKRWTKSEAGCIRRRPSC